MGRLLNTPHLLYVSHLELDAAMQLSYKGNLKHTEAAVTEVVDNRASYHHTHDPTVEMLLAYIVASWKNLVITL